MKKRKHLAAVLALIICAISGMGAAQSYANSKLSPGDYVQFGKYNSKSIIWRVIDFDKKGNPLLFSDKILAAKVYDVGMNTDYDHTSSADWEDSTVRTWLNSEKDKSSDISFAGNYSPFTTPGQFTVSATVWSQNDYTGYTENEGGFLCLANFSKEDVSAIMSKKQKAMLPPETENKKEGGAHPIQSAASGMDPIIADECKYKDDLKSIKGSYYKNVEDKIFLLSVEQFIKMNKDFGKSMAVAQPTAESITQKNVNFHEQSNFEIKGYWLRTPYIEYGGTSHFEAVYIVEGVEKYEWFGGSLPNYSSNAGTGIRPALFLDQSKIIIERGDGTGKNPYLITGLKQNTKPVNVQTADTQKEPPINTLAVPPFVKIAVILGFIIILLTLLIVFRRLR